MLSCQLLFLDLFLEEKAGHQLDPFLPAFVAESSRLPASDTVRLRTVYEQMKNGGRPSS